jgi:transposase
MDIVFESCAGLDVHKANVVACVRVPAPGRKGYRSTVNTFGTTMRDLEELRKWLQEEGVTHVAMESTGVYWKPIWNVLEDAFELILCNARDVKQVPGRKTDVKDCEWLAQLLHHGLLRGSFVPPRIQRDLRDLTRYRAKLTAAKSAEINRVQKILEDANLKLGDVASDVLGLSGRAMLDAIVAGETDPHRLADLAKHVLRKKIPQLRIALRGTIHDHHRFMLRMHLEQIDAFDARIAELDTRIKAVLDAQDPPPPAPPPDGGKRDQLPLFEPGPAAHEPLPSTPERPADMGKLSYREAVVLLDSIPGLSTQAAQAVVAEIGPDMTRFPSAAHLASWGGMCPGNNTSAGKKTSSKTKKGDAWLKRILGIAAATVGRQRKTFLSAKYARLAKRRGAKRAQVAVGHSILRIAYFILTNRQPFKELGANYYDRRDTERQIHSLRKRLAALEALTAEQAA